MEFVIKLSFEDLLKSKEFEDVLVFNREADNFVDVSVFDFVGIENILIFFVLNLNMDS